jgi:hypothetical protein
MVCVGLIFIADGWAVIAGVAVGVVVGVGLAGVAH